MTSVESPYQVLGRRVFLIRCGRPRPARWCSGARATRRWSARRRGPSGPGAGLCALRWLGCVPNQRLRRGVAALLTRFAGQVGEGAHPAEGRGAVGLAATTPPKPAMTIRSRSGAARSGSLGHSAARTRGHRTGARAHGGLEGTRRSAGRARPGAPCRPVLFREVCGHLHARHVRPAVDRIMTTSPARRSSGWWRRCRVRRDYSGCACC
jgi:hypothetical protein